MDGEIVPSLEWLLVHIFRHLQTPLLTTDRIVDFLSHSNLLVPIKNDGILPASSIHHRLILNALTNSDQFVRSGPAHIQTWALRPNNPFLQNETAIAASIEQFLSKNGPATFEQILAAGDSSRFVRDVYQKVLDLHTDEFVCLPDNRVWFKDAPVPARAAFDSVQAAIEFAMTVYTAGATIEELRRFLCLSLSQGMPITRIAVAQELAEKPQLFVQVQRGKYAMVGSDPPWDMPQVVPMRVRSAPAGQRPVPLVELGEDDGALFNPESFFGGRFCFSPE
jgi:hypothetical protein